MLGQEIEVLSFFKPADRIPVPSSLNLWKHQGLFYRSLSKRWKAQPVSATAHWGALENPVLNTERDPQHHYPCASAPQNPHLLLQLPFALSLFPCTLPSTSFQLEEEALSR